MHTEDIRCIIWAFLLLWALRWNTWFCERSFRAVLAPPYSPATLRGAAEESVSPCFRLAAAPSHGPEGPPAFRAHAQRTHKISARPHNPSSASRAALAGLKTLGAVRRVTGLLESQLAGSCHVHLAAPTIGWRVGRAQDRGGRAASSAAGLWSGSCARQRETLCGAPGGESPCSEARRGGRARLPVGRPAPRNRSSALGRPVLSARASRPQTCETDPPAPGLRSRRAKRAKRFGVRSQLGARRAVPRRLSLRGGLSREAFRRRIPRGGAGDQGHQAPLCLVKCCDTPISREQLDASLGVLVEIS